MDDRTFAPAAIHQYRRYTFEKKAIYQWWVRTWGVDAGRFGALTSLRGKKLGSGVAFQ
jgi:hypothetical protein